MNLSATRGPANPIVASASAIVTSASDARLAKTPPVVGFPRIAMKGTLSLSERQPGYHHLRHLDQRAHALLHPRPPGGRAEQEGDAADSAARSIERASRSPATSPMLPPKKVKSKSAYSTSSPETRPGPALTDSSDGDELALLEGIDIAGEGERIGRPEVVRHRAPRVEIQESLRALFDRLNQA